MTGKEENLLVEEGRNMLRVRQSSDIFALCEYYEEREVWRLNTGEIRGTYCLYAFETIVTGIE